jgi:predicted DNA-binding transcriptional regulator AlpA
MTSIGRELRSKTQPRRGLRRVEAAVYVGISATKFDEMVADGRMPRPKRIDGATVWDQRALDSAFDALPDVDGEEREDNPWDRS